MRYIDPDGRMAQAAAGLSAGALIGTAAGLTVLYILLKISLERLTDLAQEVLSRQRTWTEEHHSFPMFLGGAYKQNLVPMERSRHANLHKDLRNFLRTNEQYAGMEPKAGNNGVMIQSRFSLEARKEAMARFYLTHLDVYADAAFQYFTDNPETYTSENINWAIENAVGERVKDYLLNLFTKPTEE